LSTATYTCDINTSVCIHSHTHTHTHTHTHLAYCNTLQHSAAHCSTLQHTAAYHTILPHTVTHCHALPRTASHCNTLQYIVTRCNTLHHAAKHCNTLQHTATHCNTLQHTATQSALPRPCTQTPYPVVFVCVCVCVRATFDLQDYFDAEGVLCICVSVCACHSPIPRQKNSHASPIVSIFVRFRLITHLSKSEKRLMKILKKSVRVYTCELCLPEVAPSARHDALQLLQYTATRCNTSNTL